MQTRAEKTKQDIFNAAEIEFAEKGFYGARMDVIAEKSGANKASIYKYYTDKVNLYKEVFYNVYDRFSIKEQTLCENTGLSWREKISRFIRLDFNFLAENPTYVRLLMWENLNHGKAYKAREVHKPKERILHGLESIIKEANKECKPCSTVTAENLLQTVYACGFNYFTNMDTLSGVLGRDLSDSKVMNERIEAVSDMVIAYLGG